MRVTPENMWLFELHRLPVDGPSQGGVADGSGFANALDAAREPAQAPSIRDDERAPAQQPSEGTAPAKGVRSLLSAQSDDVGNWPIDIHGKPDHSHAESPLTGEEADRMFRLSGEIRGTGNNAAVPPGSPAAPRGYFYDPATGYQPGFTLVYGDVTDYMNPIKGILKSS